MTARVFTVTLGAVLEVGHYGTASGDTPAVVPEEVAAQLEADLGGLVRVEREAVPVPAPPKSSAKAAPVPAAAEEK